MCVYIILGLQIVNLFCILVMWKNVTIYNYLNEYDFMGLLSINLFRIFKVQTKKKTDMKKYYFSILIQDSDTISEIDALRENFSGNYDFNICAYMCDMLCGIGFEDDKDNFTDYKPYICKGSDFKVRTYREYTLIRNLAIGGDYMLYREATEDEVKWLEENK